MAAQSLKQINVETCQDKLKEFLLIYFRQHGVYPDKLSLPINPWYPKFAAKRTIAWMRLRFIHLDCKNPDVQQMAVKEVVGFIIIDALQWSMTMSLRNWRRSWSSHLSNSQIRGSLACRSNAT